GHRGGTRGGPARATVHVGWSGGIGIAPSGARGGCLAVRAAESAARRAKDIVDISRRLVMNRTLIANYLRHRASSFMRVALIIVPSIFALGSVALGHSLAPLAGLSTFYGMVLAAGAIGQDISSGTLQLLLARPVTRPGYVMSRWIAAGFGASVLYIGIVALSTI